jgi:hypothetical protein
MGKNQMGNVSLTALTLLAAVCAAVAQPALTIAPAGKQSVLYYSYKSSFFHQRRL